MNFAYIMVCFSLIKEIRFSVYALEIGHITPEKNFSHEMLLNCFLLRIP